MQLVSRSLSAVLLPNVTSRATSDHRPKQEDKFRNATKVHKSKRDKRTSTNRYRKRHQDNTSRRPKMTPGAPPNGAKSGRQTPKSDFQPQVEKNRTKTSTRPTWTRQRSDSPLFPSPPGGHLGSQIATKTDPKTIKNRSAKSKGQTSDPRRSLSRLGAILGRLLFHLGVHFGKQT